jgi:uncharacterized protein YjbI with pentapeptide repeats
MSIQESEGGNPMANEEQLALLKQGVGVWNRWRWEHPNIQPNLTGVDLSGFTKIDLVGADLSQADLSETHLRYSNLSQADLSGAKLARANISEANLSQANLSGANLYLANISFTDLTIANLSGADLSRAILWETILAGAGLLGATLYQADLTRANLSGAILTGANLEGSMLVEANLSGAILTQCSVYGASVWNAKLEGTKQDNLIITPQGEPPITVDDLEVAQFIYLLLNHKKLRNVFNAVTGRGVLLLGRFGGGGLEVLQELAAKLREEHYLPIIFDFDRPRDRNFTETIKTLAGLSRFIIADLSGPSVPQELYATVPHFKIPFVPILEAGRKQFSMAADLFEYPWVVRSPVIFASTDELISLVPSRIIAPAEEKYQARQQLLDELFPS